MLPTCCPSTPHPHSPTKPGAAIRIGSRRIAHRPGDSVEELSGTEAVRWGPDHRASPTLMADLQQLRQQDPVLRPVLTASTAKLSDTKERSARALVQHYPRRFLKNGILRRGQADQRRGILAEQLVRPSSLRPDVP